MKEWLNRKEVCEILGTSMPTLNRIMKSGKIRFYKDGGYKSAKTRFKKEDVVKYLNSIVRN